MSDSASKKLDAADLYRKAGIEPSLEEVLADPIVQLRMAASGTTLVEVELMCARAAEGLKRAA